MTEPGESNVITAARCQEIAMAHQRKEQDRRLKTAVEYFLKQCENAAEKGHRNVSVTFTAALSYDPSFHDYFLCGMGERFTLLKEALNTQGFTVELLDPDTLNPKFFEFPDGKEEKPPKIVISW